MQTVMDFLTQLRSDDSLPATENAKANPIKIAVIDTGVSIFELPAQKIHDPVGKSFVEDSGDPDSHWHSPQCSHGTKLAQLIYRFNPFCKLYVAKVQTGPSPDSVDVGAAIKVR